MLEIRAPLWFASGMHKPQFVLFNGVPQSLSSVARAVGVPIGTMIARLRRGWSLEQAISAAPLSRRQAGLLGKARSPWTHPWSYPNHDRAAEAARDLR